MKNDTPSRPVYKSEELHPTMTDEKWRQTFAFQKECARFNKLIAEDKSWQALKVQYIAQLNRGIKSFLIWKNDNAFGLLSFYEKRKTAKEYSFLTHRLQHSYFDQELIGEILTSYLSSCPDSSYLVMTSTDARNDYLEQISPIEVSEIRELFELQLADINEEVFSNWVHLVDQHKNEFEVILKEGVPGYLLDGFCVLTSELNKDVSYKSRLFDDSVLSPEQLVKQQDSYKKRGIVQLLLLMFEKQGRQLIGYTDVTIDFSSQSVAHQNMTGLNKKYRGKGLSKWLKVTMLESLQERFPALLSIKTGIHNGNIRSQNLNRKLGFQNTGFYKEYIIPRHAILDYLQ